MKKRKTTQKTANTIKATATKAVETVRETAEKVTDKLAEEAPVLAETITAKTEEIMNSPIVEEGKEIIKETKEKASQAIRTKISEVNVEIFETNVSLDAIPSNSVCKSSNLKIKLLSSTTSLNVPDSPIFSSSFEPAEIIDAKRTP